MHTIYRKQNYRNIELTSAEQGATVGVLRRDGKIDYRPWLGLIKRADAKRSTGRPVKLLISRVDGYDLANGEYVQGCLSACGGVYAVIDSKVAVIKGSKPGTSAE